MATMKSQSILSVLVLIALWRQASADTSCYKCTSTIGSDGVEVNLPATDTGSCASLTGKTAEPSGGEYGCETVFTTTTGSITTIMRRPGTATATTVKGCVVSGYTTTCSCATDKCNSEIVAAPQTFECYECQSAGYFDNGCGEKINTGSAFVRTVKGCSACYKNVAMQTDHSIQVTRGCTRSVDIDTHCEEYEGTGRSCGCKTSLCNSAETVSIKSITAFAAVLLSAVFKLMC